MTQQEYEALPLLPYINKHGHPIRDHPDLPPETKAGLPLMYILTKQDKLHEAPPEPAEDIPWYPAVQWENTPVTFDHEKPTHVMSVTTDAPAARIHVLDKNYVTLPEACKEHVNTLREN